MTMDVGQAATQWESPLWAHRGAQVPAPGNFKVMNLFNFLGIPKTNQKTMHCPPLVLGYNFIKTSNPRMIFKLLDSVGNKLKGEGKGSL